MGNTVSAPPKQPPLRPPPPSTEMVQAPPLWKNSAHFRVISPSSDLSNPSNFRHRRTQQTPVRERRRRSGVMSKEHFVGDKRTSLPPPDQFYFGRIDEEMAEENLAPTQHNEHHGGHCLEAVLEQQKTLRLKASRARQVLSGCFQEGNKEKLVSEDSFGRDAVEQGRRSSTTGRPSADIYAQFDPEIPSHVECVQSAHYLHSAEDYFRQLGGGDDSSSATPVAVKHNLMEVSILEEDESAGDVNSPVAQLFDDEGNEQPRTTPMPRKVHKQPAVVYQSLLGAFEESSIAVEDSSIVEEPRITQHDRWLAAVLEIRKQCRNLQRVSLESTETQPKPVAEESTAKKELRKSVENQVQRQIDAQLEHMQRQQGRGRSLEPRRKPPIKEDVAKGARVERLRLQYQQELERMAHKPATQKSMLKSPDSESIVQRNRMLFEHTKRSSSLPPSPFRRPDHHKPRQRSISVPPKSRQSSETVPVLLQLAGWQVPPVKVEPPKPPSPKKEPQIPVLLQLTGWDATNKPKPVVAKKLRKSTAGRLQGNVTKTFSNRRSVASAPAMLTQPRPIQPDGARHSVQPVVERPKTRPTVVEPTRTKMERIVDQRQSLASTGSIPIRTKKKPSNAMFLQQTYKIDQDFHFEPQSSPYNDKATSNPRYARKDLVVASPALSIGTAISTSSEATMPLVSEQASENAAFLFADDSKACRPMARTHRDASSFSLSTMDSRNRISGASGAVTIPVSINTSLDEPPRESTDRRVRFSDSTTKSRDETSAPTAVEIPPIEHTFSDLTDTMELHTNVARLSDSTKESSTVVAEVIPEEWSEDEASGDMADDEKTASTVQQPIMNWSYNERDSIGKGVTPLRKGASTSNATNSPFLRFKEARSKFTGGAPVVRKVSPIKKASPVKRTVDMHVKAVQSRIAEMESRRASLDKPVSKKVRRLTTGHQVLAPRKSTLVSPLFKQRPSQSSTETEISQDMADRSPTLVNGEVIDKVVTRINRYSTQSTISSPYEGQEEDEYGTIEHPNIIDEDSVTETEATSAHVAAAASMDDESEEEGDAFAEMLNTSYDDEEDSYENETVSTIRQDQGYLAGLTQYASYRSVQGDNSTVHSSSSSTVSTIKQNRLSFVSSGESTSMSSILGQEPSVLPFRDAAPVKPNEQKPRKAPGQLCLSPMQRTPMQALKWRSLAMEAQHKDSQRKQQSRGSSRRSSLSERNPNIAYY